MAKWLQIKNKAENTIDEIYIYGEIGDWWQELDAKSLADKIKNSVGDEINIRINSGGGEVFTASSFYSLLKSSGKKINVFIDGLAASAATLIACAGDSVTMPVNALYMIHNPLSWQYGNADEMREMADVLDKVRDAIVATYVQKTSLSEDKIIEMMDAETWMTAQEAKDLGFIDNIMDVAVAATTKDVITMSSDRLKNIPKQLLNAVESNKDKPKGVKKTMDLTQFKAEHSAIAEQFKAEIQAENKTAVENAVKAERQRIKDIHDTALQGQEELAQEAIENGLSAGEFAIKALKATKDKGVQALKDASNDRKVLNNVVNTPVDNETADEPTEEEKILNALDKSFGG